MINLSVVSVKQSVVEENSLINLFVVMVCGESKMSVVIVRLSVVKDMDCLWVWENCLCLGFASYG